MAETQDRGYGWPHQRLRARWKRKVDRGGVMCARCQGEIVPGQEWDLDHDDADRSQYLGPSHRWCNRGHAPIAPAGPVISPNSEAW